MKEEIILIRGNHEDLALDLLNNWHRGSFLQSHHHTNGTIDTICQLTGFAVSDIYSNNYEIGRAFLHNPYIQRIIPAMIDYFETENYIFTHGWIPCIPVTTDSSLKEYVPVADWRKADANAWNKARWLNGMEAAHAGVVEKGKTIVCGHWHCSFGHCYYEKDGGEFDHNPNFAPYYSEGIIALDSCTPISKKVNCIVLED